MRGEHLQEQHTAGQTTFHAEVERLLDQQGRTYADIARDIGLEPFGVKRPGEMLRECAGPDSKLMGYDYHFSRALIARIVANGDEQSYQTLLKLARRDRRAQRRKTASVSRSPIRDERELYGINPVDAAGVLNMTEEYLLRLEQGKRKNTPQRQRLIIAEIQQEGERRIREITQKTSLQPQGVRALVDWIAYRKRRYGDGDRCKQFSTLLPGIGHELLKYIVSGRDIPPLPVVQKIIVAGDSEWTKHLTEDWAYEYARHERDRSRTAIGRALQCMCAEAYESRGQFEKKHGVSMKKSLQRIEKGEVCEWKSIHKALTQLNVEENSPRWRWIQCLFEAHEIQPALKQWYRAMGEQNLPMDLSWKSLPGLTREESPKPTFDRIMKTVLDRYPSISLGSKARIESLTITRIFDGENSTDILEEIHSSLGPVIVQETRERREQETRRLKVAHLIEHAKTIDLETLVHAPKTIEEELCAAIDRGTVVDQDRLVRTVLTVERSMQTAFFENTGITSSYYEQLKRMALKMAEAGADHEEIDAAIRTKIAALSARDSCMAIKDAPGIKTVKIRTERREKKRSTR